MQTTKVGPWSPEEDARLAEILPHHTYAEIAEILGRTFYSVKTRALKSLKMNKGGAWRSFEKKFSMNTDKSGDCWLWTGSHNKQGYGTLSHLGAVWFAHRASLYIHNGRLPRNMLVLHKCDVKACVNPEHLYIGTYSNNVRDMLERSTNSQRVNPDIARTIKFMCNTGLLDKEVAAILGFSRMTVRRVRKGQTWGFVE